MTGTFAENIRKMLGWCPDAGAVKTRKSVFFDDMIVNTPDSGGLVFHIIEMWKKYRNRILFNAFIMTGLIAYFLRGKYDPYFFLIGLFFGMFFSLITGIIELRWLNKALAGGIKRHQHNLIMKLFQSVLIIILFAIVNFMVSWIDIEEINLALSFVFSIFWMQYLLAVYWERKNRKTLILDKGDFYAVDGNI